MKEYQFKKPEITNVWKATWNTIKIRWQFWSLFVGGFVISLAAGLLLGVGSFISVIVTSFFLLGVPYLFVAWSKARTAFWKQLAEINGWQYKSYGDHDQESGIMFRQGNSGSGNISHIIEGDIEDRRFRIFNYQFSIGYGKHKTTYHYTVFAFKFNGSFPHIYLNSKYNTYGVNVGEAVPLPSEFEKKFTLSAPRKYETEALEIFTPDVLAALLDNDFPHDVEFVDQEVLIFTVGSINSFEQLEKEFNKALEIEDLLDEKLDKFKFEKIGDMSHTLN